MKLVQLRCEKAGIVTGEVRLANAGERRKIWLVTNLVLHLERFLGQVKVDWSKDPAGRDLPFRIVQYVGEESRDWVAYASIGLSNHVAKYPGDSAPIRQEVLMLAPSDTPPDGIASVVEQIGTMILKSHRALLRGNVIGPAGPLFPGSMLTAIYVTIPIYFPRDFATVKDEIGSIIIAWLVPITSAEADYIQDNGWEMFEKLLDEQGPNLIDPLRGSVTFPS